MRRICVFQESKLDDRGVIDFEVAKNLLPHCRVRGLLQLFLSPFSSISVLTPGAWSSVWCPSNPYSYLFEVQVVGQGVVDQNCVDSRLNKVSEHENIIKFFLLQDAQIHSLVHGGLLLFTVACRGGDGGATSDVAGLSVLLSVSVDLLEQRLVHLLELLSQVGKVNGLRFTCQMLALDEVKEVSRPPICFGSQSGWGILLLASVKPSND